MIGVSSLFTVGPSDHPDKLLMRGLMVGLSTVYINEMM